MKRAKYIIQTRDLLIECGGEDYLLSLRAKDSVTVQEELIKFSGIGRKVADCVALFSLDQAKAIPVVSVLLKAQPLKCRNKPADIFLYHQIWPVEWKI